ncbi:hypothetical protein RchiOBHm_Chr1g0362451 [Rosa chinensis]|uniref:Uncharacterized protein n=1 Tax=Rosa chinensis TaxID=74649 RepID=A0A2P6SJ84_ROSCH|nr:hypothetical protein RchiOBHm_Chr1g0362451 [Rosa chinensis]
MPTSSTAEIRPPSPPGKSIVEKRFTVPNVVGESGVSVDDLGHHAGYFKIEHSHAASLKCWAVNEALDTALDSEDIEEETEEEVDKVLSEIVGESTAQLPEAVRKGRTKLPAQRAGSSQEE